MPVKPLNFMRENMKVSKPTASEHQIQSAFFKLVTLYEIKYPQLKLLFAVPNAAKRSMALAAMLKAEGMRSGIPDIMFPFANKSHNGLALEFKSAIGKPTANQSEYLSLLEKHNWQCHIVNDSEKALKILLTYLEN